MDDKKIQNNKPLYFIGITIIVLLLYLIFKNDISSFFKRDQILAKVSIFNIPKVYLSCKDDPAWNTQDAEVGSICKNALTEYLPKAEKWKALIKNKKDISCSDFSSGREAFDFFDFVSGETIQYIKQLGYNDPNNYGMVYINYKLKCENDPYGLDTNNDCWPCKNFDY